LLDDGPKKHPCLSSGPGGGQCPHYGNGYSAEPCRSCPLPGQYADDVASGSFKIMSFLRQSKPDHWGIKKAKEKSEMAELYYKTCIQCGDKKRADTYFESAGNSEDGYRKTCSKCVRDNRMKKEEDEEVAVKEKAAAKARTEAALKARSDAAQKKTPEKNTGKFTVAVDLKKYCAQEGISIEKVTSGSKVPAIAEARKRIARAMVADGIDRKLIQLKLKIGHSTLLNYLHGYKSKDDKPEEDKPKDDKPEEFRTAIKVDFTGRESVYLKICDVAKRHLRKPEDQLLWFLIHTDFDKLENSRGLSSD